MKFREKTLSSGTKLILGKDETTNDELMRKFEGKSNVILHTLEPGSPFGIIEKLEPTKDEIYESGVIVASYSQDWRDHKNNVIVNVFNGKNASKPKGYKTGTWKVKNSTKIKIKKEDILKLK